MCNNEQIHTKTQHVYINKQTNKQTVFTGCIKEMKTKMEHEHCAALRCVHKRLPEEPGTISFDKTNEITVRAKYWLFVINTLV